MQNNQSIMQISENKDGSAKVLFRIRKAEMTDVDEIMAVMHEAKNDKEHPDWFVSDDEEYVRTHIEEQGFVLRCTVFGSSLRREAYQDFRFLS